MGSRPSRQACAPYRGQTREHAFRDNEAEMQRSFYEARHAGLVPGIHVFAARKQVKT
jgi:hypothetical protein